MPRRDRRPPWQTRRALLTRLWQVGLVAAGFGLSAACDRLPGQAPRVPRIGFVANFPAGDPEGDAFIRAFIAGLGDYGYIPGRNLQLESRLLAMDISQDPATISELLRLGVDVLVTAGTGATQAAKQVTQTVPILGISVGDPLGSGLVQSLARPGGNVTAISMASAEITGKWLELLRLIVPTLSRAGFVYNPENSAHVTTWQQFSALAAASGLEAVPAPAATMADLDAAIETLAASAVEGFYWAGHLGTEADTRLATWALSHHLASVGGISSYPPAGGLLSYSTDDVAMYRRAGYYVDRVLKGAKPADLPVEVATTFDLVVNQATATALGVTIPDEVAQQVTSWI